MRGAPSGFRFGQALPVMLQSEAAECGIACLAMVANYHGVRVDMPAMRGKYATSMRGSTLRQLIEIGDQMKMVARPLKLDLDHLKQLQCPCILHWDMNHFVVLKEMSGKTAIIHDPAVGLRSVSMKDMGEHFSGIALELRPSVHFEKIAARPKFSLRSLIGRVDGLKRGFAQVLTLGIVLEIIAIASPFYVQLVVDHVLVTGNRNLLKVLAGGFGLLVVFRSAVSLTRSWVITALSTDLNYQWLCHVFSHLIKLPQEYFEKRHIGDIVSRFDSVTAIQRTLTTGFVQTVVDGLLVIGTLAMMLLYSPVLAAIAGLAALCYGLTRTTVDRALQDAMAEQLNHTAKQQTHFLETVRGIQSIRLFGRSSERRSGWLNMLADQFNADVKVRRIGIWYETANILLFGAVRVIVVLFAAQAVIDREFSAGMLFAFLSYHDQFSQRSAALIDKISEIRTLRVHADRVADIVLTEVEEPLSMAAFAPAGGTGELQVHKVSFRYSAQDALVIDDADFTVNAGECIALTGPSGCGKTTLAKLILGLHAPTAGQIVFNGQDIRALGLGQFRRMVATVMQDDTLFTGSVADNICFFDPHPDRQLVISSAQQAAIHDAITKLPMGYDSLIGENGAGLSGGQKQRLLLARALYAQPKILLLDEATSHLDLHNEREVNRAVRALRLTRIIIAHRPETIAMADRVIVIEKGKVVREFSQTPSPAVVFEETQHA